MKFIAACALLTGAGASFDVMADVWSYVDERGVAHFAASQLDPRYEVFFRGGSNLDAPVDVTPVTAPVVDLEATKVAAYLQSAPGYIAVQHHLRAAAEAHRVDYALLQALIATESGFDAGAVSAKGAIGLMQVIPETATRYGLVGNRRVSLETKLKDPRTNLWTGTRYLRDLLAMFPGDLELALAAYNAGEGAVQKAGNKVPNFPETQNYVKTVMQLYYRLNPQAARQAQPGVTLAAQSESSAVRSATPVNAQAGTLRRGNMVPSVAMPPLGTSDTILKAN